MTYNQTDMPDNTRNSCLSLQESDISVPELFEKVEDKVGEDGDDTEPPDSQQELADFREQWKRELEDKTQAESRDELEREATKWFLMGSQLEQEGQLYEAVSYYRKALHLVPDIEMKIDFRTRSPRDRQESESSIDSYDGEGMDNDLVTVFENLQMEEKKLCSPQFTQTACHISALPVEVINYIFKWVVSAQLDMQSLEKLSLVCRGFYLCSRDEELWRLACQRIWGVNTDKLKKYGSWRLMYIERPHVQYLGCYISKMAYHRQGEKGMDNFYTPWHTVVYYRFLRFFSEGIVLMMTSPEEPQLTLHKLKHPNTKVPGMLKGVYKLSGNKISAVCQRVKVAEKSNYRSRRNKNQKNQNETQQTYHMELELHDAGKRKGAKLIWKKYSIRTSNRALEEDTNNEFDLDNKSYPPMIFSPVRSYVTDVDTLLAI